MAPIEAGPVGILGGTFDPVHLGHLRLAEEARQFLGLVRVLWIPTGRPPHRGTPTAGADDRLAMTGRAIAGNPAFAIDDAEVRADVPSYTVSTLERLRAALGPDRPLVLLMGADAFRGLPTWHRWREVFGLAHLGVATRPGHELRENGMAEDLAGEWRARRVPALAPTPAGGIASFPMTALDISATSVRRLLAAGASPRYLIPDGVLDYIRSHSLYR